MYRNLFAVLATVSLGAAAVSAATPTQTTDPSLEKRVLGAQAILDSLNAGKEPAVKNDKVAQYYGYYRPFHNFCNYYYQHCY